MRNCIKSVESFDGRLKKNKFRGFTLVELIVVIAIIGVLAAILVPVMIGYIKDARKTALMAEAKIIREATDNALVQICVVEGNAPHFSNKACAIPQAGYTAPAGYCGSLTNWIFMRAQVYTGEGMHKDVNEFDRVNYRVAKRVLRTLDSSKKAPAFYKFSENASQTNPWKKSLAEFERSFPGVPMLGVVYDKEPHVVYLIYGKGGMAVEYYNGEYHLIEDNPKSPNPFNE